MSMALPAFGPQQPLSPSWGNCKCAMPNVSSTLTAPTVPTPSPATSDRSTAAESVAIESQGRMELSLQPSPLLALRTEANPEKAFPARNDTQPVSALTRRAVLQYGDQDFPETGSRFNRSA